MSRSLNIVLGCAYVFSGLAATTVAAHMLRHPIMLIPPGPTFNTTLLTAGVLWVVSVVLRVGERLNEKIDTKIDDAIDHVDVRHYADSVGVNLRDYAQSSPARTKNGHRHMRSVD